MTLDEIRDHLRHRKIDRMPKREAMALQDELPVEWRKLVYTYGQTMVFQLLIYGYEIEDALAELKLRFSMMQRKRLNSPVVAQR